MDDRRPRHSSRRIGRRQHTSNHIPGSGGRIGGGTSVATLWPFCPAAQTMPRNLTQTDTLSPQRSRALRRGFRAGRRSRQRRPVDDITPARLSVDHARPHRGGPARRPDLGPAAFAQSAAQPQSTAEPVAPSAIKVEGNQRIEADSIRTYFHAGDGQHLRSRRPRCGPQGALRHPPVRRRAHPPLRRHKPLRRHQPLRRASDRHGGREPDARPGRPGREPQAQGGAIQDGNPVQERRPAVAPDRPGGRRPHGRALSPPRLLRRADRAQDHRAPGCARRSGVRDP